MDLELKGAIRTQAFLHEPMNSLLGHKSMNFSVLVAHTIRILHTLLMTEAMRGAVISDENSGMQLKEFLENKARLSLYEVMRKAAAS